MPLEYEKDRDARIRKGESTKDAKKFAAIDYWKNHHVAVNKAHKRKKKHRHVSTNRPPRIPQGARNEYQVLGGSR